MGASHVPRLGGTCIAKSTEKEKEMGKIMILFTILILFYQIISLAANPIESALRKRSIRSTGFSQWSNYSACSTTCGEGVHQRYRTCNVRPDNNPDKLCAGDEIQRKKCIVRACHELVVKVMDNHILSMKSPQPDTLESHDSSIILIVTTSLGLLILLCPIGVYLWIYAKILCPMKDQRTVANRRRKSYYETAKYLMDKAATNWVFMKTKKMLTRSKGVPMDSTTFDDIHKQLQESFQTNKWMNIHHGIKDTALQPKKVDYDNYIFNDDNRTFAGYMNHVDRQPSIPKRNKQLESQPVDKMADTESGNQARFVRNQKPLSDTEMLQLHQLHNELYQENLQDEPIYVEAKIHLRKDMPSNTSHIPNPYDLIEPTGSLTCDNPVIVISDDIEEPLYDTLDSSQILDADQPLDENISRLEQYFSQDVSPRSKSDSDASIDVEHTNMKEKSPKSVKFGEPNVSVTEYYFTPPDSTSSTTCTNSSNSSNNTNSAMMHFEN